MLQILVRGYLFLMKIRKKLGFNLVPINILTDSFFEDEEVMFYIGHGATDYYSKPIIKEVFLCRELTKKH
jgi:hypothetical protein